MNTEVYGPPIDRDTADRWKRIACNRLNASSDKVRFWFIPLGDGGEYTSAVANFVAGGTGTRSYVASGGEGFYRLDTGGATGTARFHPGNLAAGFPLPATAGASTKIWIGARKKHATAAGANSLSMVGIWDAADAIQWGIGIRGPLSTTNFSVFGGTGTPFDTGVAIDTSVHDFELWRQDGATTQTAIDGILRATGDARATNNGGLAGHTTDAAGAQRQMDSVWWAIALVQP